MTGPGLGRRAFLHAAARGCALLLAGAADARIWTPARPRATLRIGLLLPPGGSDTSAARGVTLGIEEAAKTGELVGRAIELRPIEADLISVESLAREEGISALIGFGGTEQVRALGAATDSAGILFLNAGARADALRGAECRPSVFHVEASDAMYAAALASRPMRLGDRSKPEEPAPAPAASGSAGSASIRWPGHRSLSGLSVQRVRIGDGMLAVLWHPSLERFGAAQLNDRFRARFGEGMDGAAWAGWMAVKALWEASLRARSTEPDALRAYLKRGSTQLDGHKGWPLSFRAWDHQLRQPLYLASFSADGASRVIGEVPERRGEEGPSRELLDRLGGDASTSTCQRIREATG